MQVTAQCIRRTSRLVKLPIVICVYLAICMSWVDSANFPGDIIHNPSTNRTMVTPVQHLAKDPASTPDMLTYIRGWSNLLASTSFASLERPAQADQCQLHAGETLPTVKRVSNSVARVYAKFAGAAYCLLDQRLRDWTCAGHCADGTEGSRVVAIEEDHATQIKYLIIVNHRLQSIVLSIRGTLLPANWLINLSWVQLNYTEFPDVRADTLIHSGFHLAATRIITAVRARLIALALRYPTYTLDITGHSLGGALAQLIGLNVAGSRQVPASRIRVMTYGAPRVGNPQFARFMAKVGFGAFLRLVNNNDPIPHIPPDNAFQLARYQHAPGEKYLTGWWLGKELEQRTGWLGWTIARMRDVISTKPHAVECNDALCEDSSCSLSRVPYFNILMHLRAYDVTFGPWC